MPQSFRPLPANTRWLNIGWSLLTLLALAIGIYSLRYALPHVPGASQLPNFEVRRRWLIAHAVFSSVALLIGPWQFLPMLRNRWRKAHRQAGIVYCLAVAAGWLCSVPIAAHAATGGVASAGFLALGVLWIATTFAGYRAISRGDVTGHREWMLRSYSLTAAAITLRLYLVGILASGIPFDTGYPAIAWACWVPNLLFAEWLILRRPATADRIH